MGLSETILAAIIGALATMATAIVQLIRNRAPNESRPKKNRMRSVLATVALMIGCIVGGYAWSALRAVSAREELAATMDEQFNKRFGALAAQQSQPASASANGSAATGPGTIPAGNSEAGSAEALVHLPPCHVTTQPDEVGPVICNDRVAQTIALCAAVPSAAHTKNVRVFSRVPKSETAWEVRDLGAAAPGNLRVAAAPTEYAISTDRRSVCLDVSNWSVEDPLAVRVVVDYDFAPTASSELTAAAPTGTTL